MSVHDRNEKRIDPKETTNTKKRAYESGGWQSNVCVCSNRAEISRRMDTIGIDRFGQHKGVWSGQIDVGRCDCQDQARLFGDERIDHIADLGLDVQRLIAHWDLGQTGQVDQRDVKHCATIELSWLESVTTTCKIKEPSLSLSMFRGRRGLTRFSRINLPDYTLVRY